MDASNKQRTPRLGLRARALDLPLQASRTSSHDLDMAHSPPVLGAQPNPNPRYRSWQAHVCCLLGIVYWPSSVESGLRGPSSSILPLIACCSLAVAHYCLFSIACHFLHLVFPFGRSHLVSAGKRHSSTLSPFPTVDCNTAACCAFQAVHVGVACCLA